MILSDLIDLKVEAGTEMLGYVIDARFDHDPTTEEGAGRAHLVGFIVGPRKGASFLGYERTSVTSPWAIAHFFRWRRRDTFLVGWKDIEALNRGGVRLRDGFERQDPGLSQR